METPAELVIYADAEHGKFVLRVAGATVSHSFASTEEAIAHAETLLDVEAKLTVFDAAGTPLIVTTVIPRPQ